ncbi:MAG TPA: sigma-70 family RNA polymerase sigma factor [Puia sp.]|nr:sigma-70 family RNA polymerase sigma factor [Puia sp.]
MPTIVDNLPEYPPHTKTFSRLPDEATLVLRAAEGDQQAYARLYTYYYPNLYTSIAFISQSHEETQEIIHEVFLKMWKSREALMLVRSFEDYAYVLARNLLFNHLKRKKLDQRILHALSAQRSGDSEASPHQELLFKQYYQTALNAIQLLSEQKRKIFLLRTQQGLTLNEIAAEMRISHPAVKKHLYAAIGFVRQYIRQHAGE